LQPEGFTIGKVDVDQNQALASRFGIRHLPCLYLVRGGSTYLFDGSTTFGAVVEFAQSGYKDAEPLPYWASPLGPIGSFKGLLTRIGVGLVNIQPFLMKELGISQFLSYILTACFFGGVLLSLISLVLSLHVYLTHMKRD
jgi:hypothetical protein